tara:strand:- start:294 stop:644 length:351 start_codon:yes stop_codon:yes gene_type:complete
MYVTIKILLTALIVVAVSEISRRSSIVAGILASIPLTSLLAIIWIYIDTKDLENIRNLSTNILIMIPPSLTFFVALPLLLGSKTGFYSSILFSLIITAIVYWVYFYILGILDIKLT